MNEKRSNSKQTLWKPIGILVGVGGVFALTYFAAWLVENYSPPVFLNAHNRKEKAIRDAYLVKKARTLAELEEKVKGSFRGRKLVVNPGTIGGKGDLAITTTHFRPGLSAPPPKPTATLRLHPSAETENKDDAVRINRAIQSAEPPACIVLAEGAYKIRTPIKLKSGVVLKGEGMRRTFIRSASPNHGIIIKGKSDGTAADITSGYNPGSRILKVADATLFGAGQLARIYFGDSPDRLRTVENTFGHIVKIKRVRPPHEIELDRPLPLKYGADSAPKLAGMNSIRHAGLENLTVERAGTGARGHTLDIDRALDCRVRHCEFSHAMFSHIRVTRSSHLEFEGNYIHHGWGYAKRDGKYGYGLIFEGATTDCLVVNNVFESLRHAMILKSGANHNVFAYNFSTRNNPLKNKDDACDISAHGGYPYMNLFEGNVFQFAHSSDYFGSAGPLQTFFRNRIEGKGIIISFESHFPVIVGNELERGGIYIEDDTLGTTIAANVVKGRDLPEKVIYEVMKCWRVKDQTHKDARLVPSLYRSESPAFLTGTPWPCFGPDVTEAAKLPAQVRYDQTYSRWQPVAVRPKKR